jgi:hypothetical protein
MARQMTLVLFICKTKSRLRRRHCGLARHFKTDPTESVALCFGYAKTLHCGLTRHFKTDPSNTVALCFGYAAMVFVRYFNNFSLRSKLYTNYAAKVPIIEPIGFLRVFFVYIFFVSGNSRFINQSTSI